MAAPSGYAPPPPGPDGTAAPQPSWPQQPTQALDQIGQLLQALQQRQIPPLPTAAPAMPTAPAPQADGLALLRLILLNPQFHQTLQQTAMGGAAAPRAVALPVPTAAPPSQMRSMSIPLGAVMNAISALSGQAMTELNARTTETDPAVPEYLLAEDGDFIVDPAKADDRAALVVHLFELSEAAQALQRARPYSELDESDDWARDAGF